MSLGTILPQGYFHEDERPGYHVPPARPSWLHRLWRHLRTHTSVASSTVSAPQEERRRARTRYPCDGVDEEGRGDGLRRCGGRGNV
jgi:hypothetical protein